MKTMRPVDYWGVSYPRGMQWISENAAPGAAVNVPVAEWLVQMQAPLWLRPDIQFIPNGEQHLMEQPGRENYILFITRSGFYNGIAEECVKPSPLSTRSPWTASPFSRSTAGSLDPPC